MTVDLSDQEWQQVMALMAYAPGRECIPFLNRIGAQLQPQQMMQQAALNKQTNGKEVPVPEAHLATGQ